VSCETTLTVNDVTPPVVTLIGLAEMNVPCHPAVPPQIPGATAFDVCDGNNPQVTVSGSVDFNTPGSYTLTYGATDASGNPGTASRKVNVVDDQPPVIHLSGDSAITVECHTAFDDPGASADDACAGPVSVQVSGTVNVNRPGVYILRYNAQDPAGNAALTVAREVDVVDTTKPAITILGDNPATVECHTGYSDAGATANDTCAGTVAVTPSGTVDANTPGTYTISYSATDPAGNTGTATRTVKVVDTVKPTLALNDPTPIVLECHLSSYVERGATATATCAYSNEPTT
jgi:hypothetical protein